MGSADSASDTYLEDEKGEWGVLVGKDSHGFIIFDIVNFSRRERMTERKWTPGPWPVPHFAQDDVNCDCRYIAAEYGGMGSIATIDVCKSEEFDWGDDCGPNLEQAKANAHLIAAAPDMYEALVDVLSDLEIGAHPQLHIVAIRAALRKADGEAQ